MNAHRTTLAAPERQVYLNLPGAVEYCRPQTSGIRIMTSWAPIMNTHMKEIPSSPFSDFSFAEYDRFSSYTRQNSRGELIIAPTWVLSEYLLYSLVHGQFPEEKHTGQRQTSGTIVDCCFANAEEAGEPEEDNRFRRPPILVENASNKLVLEALMPYAHGLVVVQGEVACDNFVRVFSDRNQKISAPELKSLKLSDQQVDWLIHPLGSSRNTTWGFYAHKDNNENVHLVACVPSLTNLVPYSNRPVSTAIRQRFAHALAALVLVTRNIAGLPSTAAVETIATDFLNCLLPANAKRAQSLLSGPFGLHYPLGPQYISPMVAGGRVGGLATVASNGPQLRNGGLAGGLATVASHGPQLGNGPRAGGLATKASHPLKGNCGTIIGTSRQKNLMTADQSQRLHQLYHRKHPEFTIGFCWNCKTQLPHGFFYNSRSGAKAARLQCNKCRKSFTTREHL